MFCGACGGQLPADAQFCGFCGFRQEPLPDPFDEAPAASKAPAIPPAPAPARTAERSRTGVQRSYRGAERPRTGTSGAPIPLTQKKRKLVLTPPLGGSAAPRRDQRFPMRVEIDYGSEHNFYAGFTENISHGGVFIATHTPRPIGEMMDLTFTLPGSNRPIQVIARVKWVRDYIGGGAADQVPGMGVEFVSLGEREKRLIEAFIRHREPIFFDL